ncbi:MAG: DUF4012 domain-containing protein [Patescibacteria group bacterium]
MPDEILKEPNVRKWPVVLLVIIIVFTAGFFALRNWYRSGGLRNVVINKISEKITSSQSENNLLHEALGFNSPKTYLLLFLNNTEIRPGGGFIGAYAVVRVDKGTPEILKVEGTEILDNNSPDFTSMAPEPLKKYLGIKKWKFRDSNWSPDFASSSKVSLDFFRKEGGVAANEINAVIGFTPTLLEEVLKISGSIKVNGEVFTPENFVQKLEYEVEYGYVDKGLEFSDRKKILQDLTHALAARLRTDVFLRWSNYWALAERMLAEKQVLAFSEFAEAQNILNSKGWSGEMKASAGDYILWADANLAALKTDRVISRTLSYSTSKDKNGKYVGVVKMKYVHNGKFDDFTTRYRTYGRIYLPIGSEFISVNGSMKGDKSKEPGVVDRGIENGRQWFGAFISIEPGKTGELAWQFYLSPQVASLIKDGDYELYVQKQAGALNNKLTLDLNFDKNVLFASPGEPKEKHGDNKYGFYGDFKTDMEFKVRY